MEMLRHPCRSAHGPNSNVWYIPQLIVLPPHKASLTKRGEGLADLARLQSQRSGKLALEHVITNHFIHWGLPDSYNLSL